MLRGPLLRGPVLRARRSQRPIRRRAAELALPLVLVLTLAAALLAPEQPGAQAEICQRHNGASACRIW